MIDEEKRHIRCPDLVRPEHEFPVEIAVVREVPEDLEEACPEPAA